MMDNGIVELTENWLIEGVDSERGLAAKAYRKDYLPLQGVKTCIPSTVRNALLKEGHIADPYEGFNSETTKWVEKKEWWFFHDFPTPEYAGEQRVILTFEGITYRAEIWVNGIQADYIEGMFRVAEVDVTDYLDEKHNRLTLRIRAQENAFLDDRNSEGQNCVRTQAPVAQSMYRWNWCPHIVCIGIWQPVTLAVRNPIYIESVQIRTLSVETNGQDGNECSAADSVIGLKWTVVNRSSKPGNGRLAFCISGQSFHQENIINDTVHIAVEADSVCSFYQDVDMKNARLWWPNGLGDAELHQLETRLLDEHTNAVYDCSYDTFGIRKITFLANDDEAWVIKTSGHSTRPWSNVGEMYKWTFVINGRSVFLKGSNWVVTDSLLRLDRERYETQLNLVKTGGFNFLRVWGGSLAETREFYELCDQYGILCWQEFWLACGNYPAMRHDLFMQCVNDTVKRLINHPSLVYYSGGNEYEPDNKENNVLVDKIAAAVAEIDPEREFRRGSPYKGDKHGGLVMTPYVTRNKYLDILYGDARVVLFRSEVATGRSTPMLSSLEKMLPENKRWPVDDEYWRHFFAVPSEFKMFANEYDALDSFESAVFANYLVHSLICRYNMEYCRSQMFRCTGNLNWQFNVPWPCMHRELVDWWGVPKPAYYHYRNVSRPLVAILDLERYLWRPGETLTPVLTLVNDGNAVKHVTVDIAIYTIHSECLYQTSYQTELKENSATKVAELEYPIPADLAEENLLIHVETKEQGLSLHEQLYWIAVSNHQYDDQAICLNGEWYREDGAKIVLPGNDMNQPDDGFESVIFGDQELERGGESHGKTDGESNHNRTCYKRTFVLNRYLKNRALEFFCPGFESSDEVWINGVKIGSHTFKAATLNLKEQAFIPYGKTEPSSDIDPDSEYGFFSDPITMPKLDARFYDIPQHLLMADGENEICIKLLSRSQKACPHLMEIRPVTENRNEVLHYMKKGQFFSKLKQLPQVEVSASVDDNSIIITNKTNHFALMVIVEFIPVESDRAVALDDNAFHLLPYQKKVLTPLTEHKLALPAQIRVYGWNVKGYTESIA